MRFGLFFILSVHAGLSNSNNKKHSDSNHEKFAHFSDGMRSLSSDKWFYDSEPKVQRITHSAEIKAIRAPLLLEFFASWCPHCQHFRNDFIAITRKFQLERPELVVAAVDCVASEDICDEYNIEIFPTLRLLNVPQPAQFKGDTKAEAVSNWVLSLVPDKARISEQLSNKIRKRRRAAKKQSFANENVMQKTSPPAPQPMLPVADNTLPDDTKTGNTGNRIISAKEIKNEPNKASSSNGSKHVIKSIVNKKPLKQSVAHVTSNTQQIDNKRNEGSVLTVHDRSIIRIITGRVQTPDVSSAVVFWLQHNIFIGTDKLTGMRLAAFKQILASLQLFFFQLCAGAEEENVSAIFHSLQFIDDAIPEAGILKTEWAPLLRSSSLNLALSWTNQCETSSSSFTCGLWLLFHSMLGHTQNSEQATAACQSIVALIRLFFGCDTCRNHFLEMVPDGERTISKDDAMMWLWRSHNNVNQRLDQNERIETGISTKMQRPNGAECSACQTTTAGEDWDMNSVTEWLLDTYGPPATCTVFAPNISSATSLSGAVALSTYSVLMLFACGVILAVVVPTYASSIQRFFVSKHRTSPVPRLRRLGRVDV